MLRVKDSTNNIHLIAVGSNAFGQLGVVNNDTIQTQWKKVIRVHFQIQSLLQ